MVKQRWIQRTALVAMCAAALGATAHAEPVSRDVYYTRYTIDNPASPTETNVRKFQLTYDRSTGIVTYGPRIPIARTLGADGIVFAPDSTPGDGVSDLLIGGQYQGIVHKINLNTTTNVVNNITSVLSGTGNAYHLSIDPSLTKVWTGNLPGPLAEVPLSPFANGTAHAITGDEDTISTVAFVPQNDGTYAAFYTKSPPNGPGSFGRIDMTTFVTTRLINNLEAGHGMLYDAFSRTLILTGESNQVQIDPFQNPPAIVATLDWDAFGVNGLDLDQSSADGQGVLLGASNDGRLVFVDYAATGRIDNPANVRHVEFLDTFLDDIAPLSGFGEPPRVCCPIGSGDFDRRSAQLSQIPGLSTVPFDYRTADDFYLLPGRMYKINKISGKLITDSILPKARLELYDDCNGLPSDPPRLVVPQATRIIDTGDRFEGKKVLTVEFEFADLWLRGGESYWVSLIGAGTGDYNEQWFWGTAGAPQGGGSPVVMGRPGAFKSVINGIPNWVSLGGNGACSSCIGCTDFNFCVEADSCKILLDNGTWANTGTISLDAVSAGQNITFARTADNFVVPPCASGRLCYIEAYIASNCPQARLAIYNTSCGVKPSSFTPIATLTPSRVINTGRTVVIDQLTLPVLCLQFCGNINLNLDSGKTYSISAFGLSSGNITQKAYFLNNRDCARTCLVNFYEGFIYGPSVGFTDWTKVSALTGTPRDYSFLIAVDDTITPDLHGTGPAATACPADMNHDSRLTASDVFDFLNVYFAGCP